MNMSLFLLIGVLSLLVVRVMQRHYWSTSFMESEVKGIRIVQKTKFRWDITAMPLGHVMIEGLYFASPKHAHDWAKAYISSWPTWSYEVVLKEGA